MAVAFLAAIAWVPGAGAEERVRVLLYEGPGPVEVEEPGGRREALRPAPGGVRTAGGVLRPGWRSGFAGVRRVQGMRVRGRVEVRPSERGLLVVNELSLEAYVAGILGREMSPSWDPEALRAQAVVSRTYALYQRERRPSGEPFHLRSDTRSQVYGGLDAESVAARHATDATRGQVLTFRGVPILAAFHSASGGRTASSEEVWGRALRYLISRPVVAEDGSPDTYWRAALSGTTLTRALSNLDRGRSSAIGAVRSAEIVERSPSGRVQRLRLRGDAGEALVTGRQLRQAVGEDVVRSTLFEVQSTPGGLLFVGSGRGHGVGMSQWGARGMAERGASYQEILETFYPGTRLQQWQDVAGVVAAGG